MSLYTVYPPQKDALVPVHARAYETAQHLLCHESCCEPILSPVRAMFQQPSAVRPATGPTNSVAHPSIRGFKQPSATRPATGPTNPVAHPSIRGRAVLLKQCPPKNRPKSTPAHDSVAAAVSHKHYSIIRVGAGLIQFVHGRTCSPVADFILDKFLFRHFFAGVFCVCVVSQNAEVSVTKYNSVLFGWPVPRLGQFVGEFAHDNMI